MIIEKLVEGGCEFSHYDEDHHMSMISNSVPPNGTSSGRTSRDRDREGKGKDSGRNSPAGRPPRRFVQATSDSRSQSPARSRSTRDWERDKDWDNSRRAAHDSDRHGSRGHHNSADRDRDREDYSREDRSDHRGPRDSSDRSPFLSYADSSGIAVNRSRPSSASYTSSCSSNSDTTTSRSRALSDVTSDPHHVHAHGHATSSPSSYVDYNPPLGPDFNNSKIQRIVKGSRNNSQAGIPLRTKAQVRNTIDQYTVVITCTA